MIEQIYSEYILSTTEKLTSIFFTEDCRISSFLLFYPTNICWNRNDKVYKIAEGIEPDIVFPIEMKTKNGKTKLTYSEMQEIIKNAKQHYIDQAIAVIENKSGS